MKFILQVHSSAYFCIFLHISGRTRMYSCICIDNCMKMLMTFTIGEPLGGTFVQLFMPWVHKGCNLYQVHSGGIVCVSEDSTSKCEHTDSEPPTATNLQEVLEGADKILYEQRQGRWKRGVWSSFGCPTFSASTVSHFSLNSVIVSVLDRHHHTFHVHRCVIMFSWGICAKWG